MPIPIVMPQLGESVAEGTIIEWLKNEGDRVQKDEPILAVSTEKVDAEIPAPMPGVLSQILVRAGEVVPVGATLAFIAEGFASGTGIDLGAAPPISVPPPPSLSPEPRAPSREPPAPSREGRFYSPAVRKLAEELGVDLDEVTGSGEGGRVSKRDVEMSAEARRSRPAPAVVSVAKGGAEAKDSEAEDLLPLTKMRRTIADHMLRSQQTAPHVTSIAEADFTAVARFREERKAAFERTRGVRLTFLPFVVKATAHVLQSFPMLNARWTDEGIRIRRAIHLGIAIALEDGLVVPVLRNPGALSLSEIAVGISGLVRRAQEGRLLPEELTGSTFTVNNFGTDGNLIGTPILNQPEVGILGVGTIVKRPVVVTRDGEDAIAIRRMGYLCLSYDHRVVDGAMAGRFLQALRRALESFDPTAGIWLDPLLMG
ncbi:MAG TPA: dihydrolipoamide acetyltransferase family protein [Candidatus Methylomirabilis sp.]|nr:dihydrolipoamide acetyltransferase family protein [Candidatus Methylomirabilis sp.]